LDGLQPTALWLWGNAAMRDTMGKNADKAEALSKVENITVLDVSLTDETSVKKLFNTIIANEGTIDALINNAGVTMFGVVESATLADLQRTFDINVIAPWRLIELALPFMRKQSEGLIINISSGYGRFSSPFSAMYGASKFAVEGLSEGLHYEFRPLGVDVAIVQPGGFPTEVAQKIRVGSDTSVVEAYEVLTESQNELFGAMGHMFETVKPNPQDVADAVVNLINLEAGKRPLRTVVDPSIGEFVENANDAVAVEYEKVLTAYGLKDFLA
jgi:short-subunit dehydrogenase